MNTNNNNFYVKALTPFQRTVYGEYLEDGSEREIPAVIFKMFCCDQDGQRIGEEVWYGIDGHNKAFRLAWHDGMECNERIDFESEEEAYRSCLGDLILIHGPDATGGRWNLQFIESIPVEASNRVVL